MTMINVDFKAYAQEIAKLLDEKEESKETRGDGKIEGSIWARYSGTEGAEKIAEADAVKIITQDLMDKGVQYMRGLLHGLGIEWNPGKAEDNSLEDLLKKFGKGGEFIPQIKPDDPGAIKLL